MDVSGLHSFVLHANRQAMEMLRHSRYEASLRLLHEAQHLLESRGCGSSTPALLAITLNNLACYFKRIKKPLHALKHLYEALQLEARTNVNATSLAGTHLNICAIKSQMGKHEAALAEATRALEVLADAREASQSTASTLAIAYHNAGVELEYLQRFPEAENMFRTGWEVVQADLGTSHQLVQSLYDSMKRVGNRKPRDSHSRNRSLEETSRSKKAGTPSRARGKTPGVRERPQTRIGFAQMEESLRVGTLNLSGLVSALNSTQSRYKSTSPTPIQFPHGQRSLKPSRGRIKRKVTTFQALLPAPPPNQSHASATSSNSLEKRVERIDSQLQSLRKQMTPGNFGRLSEPVIPPRPPSQAFTRHKGGSSPMPDTLRKRVETGDGRVFGIAMKAYLVRKRARERVRAAVKIQTYIRKKQCSILYRNIRAAVVFIQRTWRRLS